MIGKLDRRITIERDNSVQDLAGGISRAIQTSWTLWANVETRSGRPVTNQNQVQFNYDYKITFRYEKSRKPRSNDTIVYDNMKMMINSISFENEGNKKYVIARCSVTENHES